MITVNIHEATARPSKLVDKPIKGDAIVIANAGKPSVKVASLDTPDAPQRLGFRAREIVVPKDFARMGDAEIAALFGVSE